MLVFAKLTVAEYEVEGKIVFQLNAVACQNHLRERVASTLVRMTSTRILSHPLTQVVLTKRKRGIRS